MEVSDAGCELPFSIRIVTKFGLGRVFRIITVIMHIKEIERHRSL